MTYTLEYDGGREDLGTHSEKAKRRARYFTKEVQPGERADLVAVIDGTETRTTYLDGKIVDAAPSAQLYRFPSRPMTISRDGEPSPRPALLAIRLGRKVKNPVERAPRFIMVHATLIFVVAAVAFLSAGALAWRVGQFDLNEYATMIALPVVFLAAMGWAMLPIWMAGVWGTSGTGHDKLIVFVLTVIVMVIDGALIYNMITVFDEMTRAGQLASAQAAADKALLAYQAATASPDAAAAIPANIWQSIAAEKASTARVVKELQTTGVDFQTVALYAGLFEVVTFAIRGVTTQTTIDRDELLVAQRRADRLNRKTRPQSGEIVRQRA